MRITEERLGRGVLALYVGALQRYQAVAQVREVEVWREDVAKDLNGATLRIEQATAGDLLTEVFGRGRAREWALVFDEPLNGINRPRGGYRVLRFSGVLLEWQLLPLWDNVPAAELRFLLTGRARRGYRLRLDPLGAAMPQPSDQPAAREATTA